MKNYRDGREGWLENAAYYLQSYKFKFDDDYNKSIKKINKAVKTFEDAEQKCKNGKEGEAVHVLKTIVERLLTRFN